MSKQEEFTIEDVFKDFPEEKINDMFKEVKASDLVNSPPHYGQGRIECIEYIKDFLSDDEYTGYLRGNIAKYLHRWRYKNGVEDLKKARWYLEALIQQQSRK